MKTEEKIIRGLFFGTCFTAYIVGFFGLVVSVLDPKLYEVLLG